MGCFSAFDRFDMGEVFPTGVATAEELAQYLTAADYFVSPGDGGQFDLIVIPEPSGPSANIVLITLTILLTRRWMTYSSSSRNFAKTV